MDTQLMEYKIKVWNFLEEMEPDKMYTISNLCCAKNQLVFVEAIKEYMRSLPWNGWVTFNRDYTKIYRSHPPEDVMKLYEQAQGLNPETK